MEQHWKHLKPRRIDINTFPKHMEHEIGSVKANAATFGLFAKVDILVRLCKV